MVASFAMCPLRYSPSHQKRMHAYREGCQWPEAISQGHIKITHSEDNLAPF